MVTEMVSKAALHHQRQI